MDTGKMVRLGRLWITLPAQHLCKLAKKNQKMYEIFYSEKPLKHRSLSNLLTSVFRYLSDRFKVSMSASSSGCYGSRRVNYIEHVILYLKIEYQRRGDLRVILISPAGLQIS